MAQNDTAIDDAERLDKELVARALGQLGDQRNPHEDGPEMRYLNIAAWSGWDNIHRGLFIDAEDPDGQLMYGHTTDEHSTWEIEDVGDKVAVDSVSELELADNDDQPDSDKECVQAWMEIIVDEYRYDVANGATSPGISDEISFVGQRTLRLSDWDGRKAVFAIDLKD